VSLASLQLGHAASLGTGGATIYTVPAGKRTILKSVLLQNSYAGSNRVILTLHLAGGANIGWGLTLGTSGTATESLIWLPWIVMMAGDYLTVAPTNSPIQVLASGAELSV
jgi:hypothetical protein